MKVTILSLDHGYFSEPSKQELISFTQSCCVLLKKRIKKIIPDISLIFIDEKKMKEMNKKYRSLDSVTDVLSFPSEEVGYLGDVVLSKSVIAEKAKEYGCSFIEELHRDIIHGVLHLLGYDHRGHLGGKDSNEEIFLIQENLLHILQKEK